MHGAQRRHVLQAHLGRAVRADRDAGVRADEADARPADRRHPDEVVGAGEEGGERGRERDPAAHLHADGRGEHLLLGDIALEEPLRVRLRERRGAGGVAHLAVEDDDVGPGVAEGGQGLAEGGPRRLHGPRLVGRRPPVRPATTGPASALGTRTAARRAAALSRRAAAPGSRRGGRHRGGRRYPDPDVADAAELADRRPRVRDRLAVRALPCPRRPRRRGPSSSGPGSPRARPGGPPRR